VVGQSLALACAGVLAGLGLAWVATRALQSLLYGVSPADPVVLAISVVTLIVVAFAASLAPARRAARIDPVDAIKT
jgi:ABC-type antimicrobial peptide transport system permease subunit